MKLFLRFRLIACLCAAVAARGGDTKLTKLTAVPFNEVKFADEFWTPRLETNRTVTIMYDFKKCEETGRIDNFAKAGGMMKGEFRGIPFDDSDVFKVIEGAAYSLATHPDPKLDQYLDELIAKIAAAQEPDGYLYTARRLFPPEKMPEMSGPSRWSNEGASHELYNVGHLYEAAVAHFRATGKRTLLNIAIKNADLIVKEYGPGKHQSPPGHAEIEIGLVKLYQVTGTEAYLQLAKFLIEVRGRPATHPLYGDYAQDHKPLVEQDEAIGHAVRAGYFYSGVADVAALTGDAAYLAAIDRLWDNVATKKLYITGGIGARGGGEAFGANYELPNETAYAETCAAIANALWNHRMNLLHADAKYADVLERVIYNGFLSGVALGGDKFFYVNPLASRGDHHRQAWFGCACCPVNVVRFLPSLPGYVYATAPGAIYVNLFVAGAATVKLPGGTVKLTQQTRYPWDGNVKIGVEPESAAAFALNVRIPGWCDGATVKINGAAVEPLAIEKGYAKIQRQWKSGDVVELDLPMPVKRVKADPNVKADVGRVALQRGPIVYCLEAVDNGGRVYHLSLPPDAPLTAEHRGDLLGGVTVVHGTMLAHIAASPEPKPVAVTAVPYFAWDNRDPGQMIVWIPEDPALAEPIPQPTLASASQATASFCFANDTVRALNDQIIPANSHDHSVPRLTWWDHKGLDEWVQYDFPTPTRVSSVEVYWFDDTRTGGGCRVPKSWHLLYKDGDSWKPVESPSDFGIAADQFNKVTFTAVETSALRLAVRLQSDFSSGILEWRVK